MEECSANFMGKQLQYDGEWNGDKRHGKGKCIWGDGVMYEGYWESNNPSGKGRMIHENGTVYNGLWLDGKPHGYGVLTKYEFISPFMVRDGVAFEDNKAVYEGQWKNGEMYGLGKVTYHDGSTYTGEFKGGYTDGKYICKYYGSEY